MTPEQKKQLEEAGLPFRQPLAASLSWTSGFWEGAGYVLYPLSTRSAGLNEKTQMQVVSPTGTVLGVLLFLKGRKIEEVGALSDVEYVAYVSEVEPTQFARPYLFGRDYLAIEVGQRSAYEKDYLLGSPIWGGFVHAHPTSTPAPIPLQTGETIIAARPLKKLPTKHHELTSARSALEPFAFERFLKLYHMLELLFDWDLVQRIKGLNDDLEGIGKLLTLHKSRELHTLQKLLEWRVKDVDRLAVKLADVAAYAATARRLFFSLEKEGNPMEENDFDLWFVRNRYSRTELKKHRPKALFEEMTYKIAAFWIYRVRSSIAHQKIGEFIFEQPDEQLVLGFAEPLIREVLCQAFE